MSGIISDNQGRSSGLVKSAASSDYVKLNTTTVSSAVATVSIDGHFTSDYDYYNLYLTNVCPTADTQYYFRFNSGGSALTASNYRNAVYTSYNKAGTHRLDSEKHGQYDSGYVALTVADSNNDLPLYGGVCGEIQIFQPLNATPTPQFLSKCYATSNTGAQHHYCGGYYNVAGAISGITLYFPSQNTESGTFTLFGVKK